MRLRVVPIAIVAFSAFIPSRADDTLYRYEGDVLPYDESAGWRVYDPCESPCTELLEDGHFVLFWPEAGDLANYAYRIAEPPDAPPLRYGSRGGFARTIRSAESSLGVTGGSRSSTAE